MPDDATGTVETTTSTESRQPRNLRLRVGQLAFLALAVVATLGLAWWQWGRWSSGDGSYQNLGYALQWPIFGLFFIFAYRKYMQYERDRAAGIEEAAVAEQVEDAAPRAIPEDVLPTRNPVSPGDDPLVDDRRRQARSRRDSPPTDQTAATDDTSRTD